MYIVYKIQNEWTYSLFIFGDTYIEWYGIFRNEDDAMKAVRELNY